MKSQRIVEENQRKFQHEIDLRNERHRLREIDLMEERERMKKLDMAKKERIISKELKDAQTMKQRYSF